MLFNLPLLQFSQIRSIMVATSHDSFEDSVPSHMKCSEKDMTHSKCPLSVSHYYYELWLTEKAPSIYKIGGNSKLITLAMIGQFQLCFRGMNATLVWWKCFGRLCSLFMPGPSLHLPIIPSPSALKGRSQNHIQTNEGLLPLCLSLLLHHLLFLGCNKKLCLLTFPEGEKYAAVRL